MAVLYAIKLCCNFISVNDTLNKTAKGRIFLFEFCLLWGFLCLYVGLYLSDLCISPSSSTPGIKPWSGLLQRQVIETRISHSNASSGTPHAFIPLVCIPPAVWGCSNDLSYRGASSKLHNTALSFTIYLLFRVFLCIFTSSVILYRVLSLSEQSHFCSLNMSNLVLS